MNLDAKTVRAGFLPVFLCAAALLLGACDDLITVEEKAPVVVGDASEPNLEGTCILASPGDDTDGHRLSNFEDFDICTYSRLADIDCHRFFDLL